MRNLPEDESQLLAQIGRSYPQLVSLLDRVRREELELMVNSSNEFFPMYKGRIGMLTELTKHIRPQLP